MHAEEQDRLFIIRRKELKDHLVCFMKEFADEIEATNLTEEYLHECIVEMNKAFINTLEDVESNYE